MSGSGKAAKERKPKNRQTFENRGRTGGGGALKAKRGAGGLTNRGENGCPKGEE